MIDESAQSGRGASGQGPCVVRLSAPAGRPLADAEVREQVLSIALKHAASEGIDVLRASADDRTLEVAVALSQEAALLFMAHVRKLTNAWYIESFDVGPLWPVAIHHDDDDTQEGLST
jgi:hypothetical protein